MEFNKIQLHFPNIHNLLKSIKTTILITTCCAAVETLHSSFPVCESRTKHVFVAVFSWNESLIVHYSKGKCFNQTISVNIGVNT